MPDRKSGPVVRQPDLRLPCIQSDRGRTDRGSLGQPTGVRATGPRRSCAWLRGRASPGQCRAGRGRRAPSGPGHRLIRPHRAFASRAGDRAGQPSPPPQALSCSRGSAGTDLHAFRSDLEADRPSSRALQRKTPLVERTRLARRRRRAHPVTSAPEGAGGGPLITTGRGDRWRRTRIGPAPDRPHPGAAMQGLEARSAKMTDRLRERPVRRCATGGVPRGHGAVPGGKAGPVPNAASHGRGTIRRCAARPRRAEARHDRSATDLRDEPPLRSPLLGSAPLKSLAQASMVHSMAHPGGAAVVGRGVAEQGADAAGRAVLPAFSWGPRVDDRRVISGIIFVLRNGLRWRDAPLVYGPPKTIDNRFIRRSRPGVFNRILSRAGSRGQQAGPVDARCRASEGASHRGQPAQPGATPMDRPHQRRAELQAARPSPTDRVGRSECSSQKARPAMTGMPRCCSMPYRQPAT